MAFLRGINLGRRRITMKALRALFSDLGFTDVATIAASGNVLFTPGRVAPAVLERRIEKHLHSRLGYEVETFVRTAREVTRLAGDEPFPDLEEAGPSGWYVLFFKNALAAGSARRLAACRTPVDQFRVAGREVYWSCRVPSSQSVVWKSPEVKALALPRSTMRNVTTVRRVAAMLERPTVTS